LTVMPRISVAIVAVSDLDLFMVIALFPIATVGQAQPSGVITTAGIAGASPSSLWRLGRSA